MLVAELIVSVRERFRFCISGLLKKAPAGIVGVLSTDALLGLMSLYVPKGVGVESEPAESGGSKNGLCLEEPQMGKITKSQFYIENVYKRTIFYSLSQRGIW